MGSQPLLQAVTVAVAHRHAEDDVRPAILLRQGALAALRGQQPDATRRPAAGQHRLHGADRAGVAVPAGGRDLGPPPGHGVGVRGVNRRVAASARGGLGLALPAAGRRRLLVRGRRRGRRDDGDHAAVVLGGQPDVEIGAQRPGHLAREERAQADPGDPADHLADQVALGHRVVAGLRPRLPAGRLRGQPRRRLRPVVQVGDRHRLVPGRQPGRVRQQVPDLDVLLARGGELGPVPGHRRGQVEVAAVGQDQRTQRRHRLGGGTGVEDGVALPGRGACRVGVTAPQVDHRLAVQVHRHRGADVMRLQRLLQRLPHSAEPVGARAVSLGHGRTVTRRRPAEPPVKHGPRAQSAEAAADRGQPPLSPSAPAPHAQARTS